MLRNGSTMHQPNLFETDLLLQLDPADPLLKLASAIPWQDFEVRCAVKNGVHEFKQRLDLHSIAA